MLFAANGERVAESGQARIIDITPATVSRLSGQFNAVWNRDPTPEEREGMISEFIREEVLYREAVALGLDRDDAVVRQRMRLKMEFLSDGMAGSLMPDEATLADWFKGHAKDFTPPAIVSFVQIPLGEQDDARALISRLEAGAGPGLVGRSSLLPQHLDEATEAVVDGNFGTGYYALLTQLPVGRWAGPVESSYGTHVVMVRSRVSPPTPALDEVRRQVVESWRREQSETLRDTQFSTLLSRYEIVRSDGVQE